MTLRGGASPPLPGFIHTWARGGGLAHVCMNCNSSYKLILYNRLDNDIRHFGVVIDLIFFFT